MKFKNSYIFESDSVLDSNFKFMNTVSIHFQVRREKISERMKLLQDLVPGCNKVIGKALMLDEIINYVQSLQRQVEVIKWEGKSYNF